MQIWQSLVDGFRLRVGRKAIAVLARLQNFRDFKSVATAKEVGNAVASGKGGSGVDVKEGHHAELALMLWNVRSGKSRGRTDGSFLDGVSGMEETLLVEIFLPLLVVVLSCVVQLVRRCWAMRSLCRTPVSSICKLSLLKCVD